MRKLAIFALGFAGAVFAAGYLLPPERYLLCAVICAAALVFALIFRNDFARRAAIVCLAAAVGFCVCAGYYSLKTVPAKSFSGKEKTVSAVVVDYPQVYDNYCSATVKLRGDAPHVRCLVYGSFSDCVPGDIVSFTASIKPSDTRYGKPWSRYEADGIYLTAYANDTVLITGHSRSVAYLPQVISRSASRILTSLLPSRSGAFATALLLGDKEGLSEDSALYSDLADAGILHVVAISGMHIAFLIGFLRLIIRRKRLATFIGIPVIWLFALIAGATPSVLRAAVMQTLVLSAPLLRRESDGLTSLSAALIILLAINPDSCASVSLQLSFGAMLGMILFTGKINRAITKGLRNNGLHKFVNKLLYAIASAFSASIGAMVFTVPLMALHFGYFSLYSIIVNITIFWAVSADFIFAGLAALFGAIWLPLGAPFVWCGDILSSYVTGVSSLFAGLPYAIISTRSNIFVWALIAIYIISGVWYAFGRRKISGFVPASAAVCLLCAAIIYTELSTAASPAVMTALDVGQGQCLLFTEGRNSLMVDCGGRNSADNAGDVAALKLLSEGRRSIDLLALTHFDDDHVNGVERLMCRIKVKNLVIPNIDSEARQQITTLAEKQDVKVYINTDGMTFSQSDLTLTAFKPVSKTEPELFFLVSHKNCDILITGDANEDTEARFLLTAALPDTEIFVAGHHGSKHASTEALLSAAKAETAVISVGYNSYGHPAAETLTRLSEAGMAIMRTDELGDITLHLEN